MVIRSRAYQKVMPFCWHRLSKCGLLSSKWKTSVSVMGNAKSNCGFCNPFIVVPWSVFPVALFPLCDGCHEFTPFRAQATSKHLVLPDHHAGSAHAAAAPDHPAYNRHLMQNRI